MEHLREQILARVEMVLTGLPEVGKTVDRSRVRPYIKTPSINILQGEDVPTDDATTNALNWFVDRRLTVNIEIRNRNRRDIETWLNRIALEITRALQAENKGSPVLGVGGTYNIIEGPTGDVEVEQGDQAIAMLPMAFDVQYRTTRADPSLAQLPEG